MGTQGSCCAPKGDSRVAVKVVVENHALDNAPPSSQIENCALANPPHLAPTASPMMFRDQSIRSFYQRAVEKTLHGYLKCEHLQNMAQQLKFSALGDGEWKRVYDYIPRNADGNVGLTEFTKAVADGPGSFTLNALLDKFESGYDFGFAVAESYDYTKSTNENYKMDNLQFVGEFAIFRAKSDYSYHVNYTPRRQAWQDAAIKSILKRADQQPAPWLVYTCGPMGVGKGYALSWMSKEGYFPLENIVHIDPDQFKLMMPEWHGYVTMDKERAGTLCHMESTFMMEIAQAAGMRDRQNIWIDGSLRNAEFYRQAFEDIRTNSPHYRIAIFYVTASENAIRHRIKIRAEQTGRDIPEHLIVASLQAMDKSLNTLTPLCDFVARISNENSVPKLLAFETVDKTGCWAAIDNRFGSNYVANKFPQALPPLNLHPVSADLTNTLMSVSPTEFKLLLKDANVHDSPSVSTLRNVLQDDIKLHISPMSKITLSDFDRRLAGIPVGADKFFWIYPGESAIAMKLASARKTENLESLLTPVIMFISNGGFCYCKEDNRIVVVNAVFNSAEEGFGEAALLQFGKPAQVAVDVVASIPSNRFHPVTLPFLLSSGIEKFAWINPNETFNGENIGRDAGSFIYQKKDGSAIFFSVAMTH